MRTCRASWAMLSMWQQARSSYECVWALHTAEDELVIQALAAERCQPSAPRSRSPRGSAVG
jgi:hypothetical protein